MSPGCHDAAACGEGVEDIAQMPVEIFAGAPRWIVDAHFGDAAQITRELIEQPRGAVVSLRIDVAHEQPLAGQDGGLAGAQQQEIASIEWHYHVRSRSG
jgi:hypothetical protein